MAIRKIKADMVILGVQKQELVESIQGLEQLKPVLQKQVIYANGKNTKQGLKDAKELGKHFDTAITAMQMVLSGYPD